MIVGTTAGAGKSMILMGLCRRLARQGIGVAPFKGVHLGLDIYVTPQGYQLGYSQALNAWAGEIAPRLDMNPVVLKPLVDDRWEIILGGRTLGAKSREDYYTQHFDQTWAMIKAAVERLHQRFPLLLIEGEGNPTDHLMSLNDRVQELANLRLAHHLGANILLVADLQKGGTLAQVLGTLSLLSPEERSLFKGIILNKAQQDPKSLQPGIEQLEQQTQLPVLGVIPWLPQLTTPERWDFWQQPSQKDETAVTIAVIRLPHIASFTEFDALDMEPTVHIRYLTLQDTQLGYPDAVILPGSRAIISDLLALQQSALAPQLIPYVDGGGTILGICGGFQILGELLMDPEGLEGQEGRFKGLGLLPIRSIFTDQTISQPRHLTTVYPQEGLPIEGYELQRGSTLVNDNTDTNFYPLFDDPSLGLVGGLRGDKQAVWGTHLHGIFENGPWRRMWLNRLRQQRGLKALPTGIGNYRLQRDDLFNYLADTLDTHVRFPRELGLS